MTTIHKHKLAQYWQTFFTQSKYTETDMEEAFEMANDPDT